MVGERQNSEVKMSQMEMVGGNRKLEGSSIEDDVWIERKLRGERKT